MVYIVGGATGAGEMGGSRMASKMRRMGLIVDTKWKV